MRLPLFIAACLAAGTVSAEAATDRFFCSADDKDVRFTVEGGFRDSFLHELNHFRGMMMLKTGDLAPVLGKRLLESEALAQSWSYDGELRLEIAQEGKPENGALATRLYIVADQGANPASAFAGAYRLALTGQDRRATFTGKVSCGYK